LRIILCTALALHSIPCLLCQTLHSMSSHVVTLRDSTQPGEYFLVLASPLLTFSAKMQAPLFRASSRPSSSGMISTTLSQLSHAVSHSKSTVIEVIATGEFALRHCLVAVVEYVQRGPQCLHRLQGRRYVKHWVLHARDLASFQRHFMVIERTVHGNERPFKAILF